MLDGPVPVLRHPGAPGFGPGEQSGARAQASGRRLQSRAFREENAVNRRISAWGFADFELISSPRGMSVLHLPYIPRNL